MASGNYREYLKSNEVKLKKYFYVLRPLLACEWILKNNTPPPMPFNDLLFLLPEQIKPLVDNLLSIKVNKPEIVTCKKILPLNDWIETEFESLQGRISELQADKKPAWEELNKLFISELNN
jgi:predicted nucleotidyltransferase